MEKHFLDRVSLSFLAKTFIFERNERKHRKSKNDEVILSFKR